MDRLTKERLGITDGKEFVMCNHEKSDCNDSCQYGVCEWNEKVQMRLHEYEDTGLSPEEIKNLNTFDGSQGVKYLKLYQEEQRKHCLIPVSERLPVGREFKIKAGDKTLYKKLIVQTRSFNIRTAHYDIAAQTWYDYGDHKLDVVAWMPVPELYHES